MKIRNSNKKGEKIEPQMAPMIDVVFQLLIFFMLTLKIIPPEGNFNINMPIGQSNQQQTDVQIPDIKVRLIADRNSGHLAEMRLGRASLGNDPNTVYATLNNEILKIIGRPGNPLTKDIEVEIEADFNLHYKYTVKTVAACMGRLDTESGEVVPYIQKVKFAPPKRQVGG